MDENIMTYIEKKTNEFLVKKWCLDCLSPVCGKVLQQTKGKYIAIYAKHLMANTYDVTDGSGQNLSFYLLTPPPLPLHRLTWIEKNSL